MPRFQRFCSLDDSLITSSGHVHLKDKLKEIERLGGEGVMLRAPNSFYEPFRSSTLLKAKRFFDAEAKVMAHLPPVAAHLNESSKTHYLQ